MPRKVRCFFIFPMFLFKIKLIIKKVNIVYLLAFLIWSISCLKYLTQHLNNRLLLLSIIINHRKNTVILKLSTWDTLYKKLLTYQNRKFLNHCLYPITSILPVNVKHEHRKHDPFLRRAILLQIFNYWVMTSLLCYLQFLPTSTTKIPIA